MKQSELRNFIKDLLTIGDTRSYAQIIDKWQDTPGIYRKVKGSLSTFTLFGMPVRVKDETLGIQVLEIGLRNNFNLWVRSDDGLV